MTDGTEYLRAAGIARLTGVSIRTARRWIAKRLLASGKVGGTRLVAKAELGRLLSPPPTATEENTKDDEKNQENEAILALSGKLSARTRSMYGITDIPNGTTCHPLARLAQTRRKKP